MYRLNSKTYPRNITLRKEQHKEIYPDKVPRRITYLFGKKAGNTIPMPDEIALYLIKHYDVTIVGRAEGTDDLDEMLWQDLQKLGRAYCKIAGEKNEIWGLKRPQLTAKIRKWRDDGVEL